MMMKLLITVAFLIGLTSIASVIIIGMTSSEPTVVAEPYETGLQWDAIQRRKIDSGWAVHMESSGIKTGVSDLIVRAADRHGNKLSDAEVWLRLERARVTLPKCEYRMERMPDGRYHALVFIPIPGRWDVMVTILRDDHRISFTDVFYAEGQDSPAPSQ